MICMKRDYFYDWLTEGKDYNVINETEFSIYIKADDGHGRWFSKSKFKEDNDEKK